MRKHRISRHAAREYLSMALFGALVALPLLFMGLKDADIELPAFSMPEIRLVSEASAEATMEASRQADEPPAREVRLVNGVELSDPTTDDWLVCSGVSLEEVLETSPPDTASGWEFPDLFAQRDPCPQAS